MVAGAGGHAHEGELVRGRDRGDESLRAIADGHPQRVRAAGDGLTGKLDEVVAGLHDRRLDTTRPRVVGERDPRRLTVAGPGVDEQHGAPRRMDALPPFLQSTFHRHGYPGLRSSRVSPLCGQDSWERRHFPPSPATLAARLR